MCPLGHGNQHDIHHSDAAHEQPDRTDHRRQNHQRTGELVPQIAQKVRGTQLKIIFLARRDAPQPPQGLDHFPLGRLHVHVFGNGKNQEQFLGLGVFLVEFAQRDDGENIHARAKKQALIVLERSDDFIRAAVEAHGLAERVFVGKKRLADRGA